LGHTGIPPGRTQIDSEALAELAYQFSIVFLFCDSISVRKSTDDFQAASSSYPLVI